MRRPAVPEGATRLGGRDLPRPARPWDERPGRCVALVAHGGTPLPDADLAPPVTFLLGAEREGLPEEHCTLQTRSTISLSGDAESLNVAAAGAIALYERRAPPARRGTGGACVRPWKTLARRTLLDRSPWLSVESHVVELPDGRVIEDWPWVISREFVTVAAVTERGRSSSSARRSTRSRGRRWGRWAGISTRESHPLDAARRELLEETGYEAEDWTPLGRFAVDGNRGCGVGHLFLAVGARKVAEPAADDLEEQELLSMTRDEVEAALSRASSR